MVDDGSAPLSSATRRLHPVVPLAVVGNYSFWTLPSRDSSTVQSAAWATYHASPWANHDGVILTTTVQDAVGGTLYASYVWDNSAGKKFWEVPDPTECSVRPHGHAEIICGTEDEFNALVDKNFELQR